MNHYTTNLNYSIKICSLSEICDPGEIYSKSKSNVYSSERIVSANLTIDNFDLAKRVRLFYWEIT